jgi:hypothetical protein
MSPEHYSRLVSFTIQFCLVIYMYVYDIDVRIDSQLGILYIYLILYALD